jgi:hypothetical protein
MLHLESPTGGLAMRRTALLVAASAVLAGCASPFREPYTPPQLSAMREEAAAREAVEEQAAREAGVTAMGPVTERAKKTFERPTKGIRLWPLLDVDREGLRRRTEVLWPLIKRVEQPEGWYLRAGPLRLERFTDRRATTVFPLFSLRKEGDSSWAGLLVVFWRGKSPEEKQLVAFPFLWLKRGEDSRHTSLWPLFGKGRKGEERWVRLLWPLFAFRSWEDGDKNQDYFWPLLRRSVEEDKTTWRVAGLLTF